MKYLKHCLLILTAFTTLHSVSAQFIDTTVDRVKTPIQVNMSQIGTLNTRSTKEIKSSNITVGCETLDRGFTIWDNYKAYLPPLGVKTIRLQAGWAKIEKSKGIYDWSWLDKVIDYAVENSINPWLELSYGNPLYKGGGGTSLLNSLMSSKEGWDAWDRWVKATVEHYKNRVHEWEIWNEPDHPMQNNSPEIIAELNIRTAEIIKKIQPNAKIAGLTFASNNDTTYLNRFLKVIASQGKLGLFTWLSYHAYSFRPEDVYANNRVMALQRVIKKYSHTLQLRQGESGAPSTYIPGFALDKYYWTEYAQAKWDMRRLLGDIGRGIGSSVFTIIDIYYDWGKNGILNTKGLIQSDTSMMAVRPKIAYYAIQNIASIFDDNIEINPDFSYSVTQGGSMSVFGFRNKENHSPLIALWLDKNVPTNSFKTTIKKITIKNCYFSEPVWVDLMTGKVWKISKSQWSRNGNGCTFNIPVYDSPILIAEKSVLNTN